MNNQTIPEKGKSWVKRHPILTTIGVLFVIGLIGSSLDKSPDTKTTPDRTSSVQTETKKESESIKVTSSAMVKEYIANEVSADTKYKGKLVEISGTIKDIGKDIVDTPYIIIESNPSDYFTQIQCMFSKSDIETVGSLQKNTAVVAQGEVSGKLGNILIRECKIIK